MHFDWNVLVEALPLFLQGAVLTVEISLVAAVAGFLVAIPICLMRLSAIAPLRWMAIAYTEVLRNVPFIILLFLIYYGLPFFGIRFPALFTGTLALALFGSAYYTEAIRSAVLSVPEGQMQSARAVGMSYMQGLVEIVAPQTIRFLIPPATNTTTTLIKELSVLSTITVAELTFEGLVVQGHTFAPMEVFVGVAAIYWLLTACVARLIELIEKAAGGTQASEIQRSTVAARYLLLDYRQRQ